MVLSFLKNLFIMTSQRFQTFLTVIFLKPLLDWYANKETGVFDLPLDL